jgi:hypothetical protein
MLDGVTYRRAKSEQEYLCNCEKGGPKDDIADGPSIFQGTKDQDQLRDDVDDDASQRPKKVDDPKCEGLGITEP